MKTPRIIKSLEYIDDELIATAEETPKAKLRTFKWTAVAACFLAVIIVSVITLPPLFKDNAEKPTNIDPRYKEFVTSTHDSAIIWPWEYLAESEKPYETEIDGIKYDKNSGNALSEEYIGDKIGTYTITGYDELSDEQPTVTADVYTLKNVSKTEFIAVKIEDSFYPFKNAAYNPPMTLGELFGRIDFSQFFKLERFSENSDGPEANHYILSDDAYIWEVLSTCNDAKFIDENEIWWHPYERDFIQFTISSEALGIYKHSLLITDDGYLKTNAFNWGYLYYIGEEATEKIIKYAMKNSTKTEYEPYHNTNYVTGEVCEITESYILIDDSILCKNAADGITYKILLEDIRVSRYIDRNIIKLGDIVEISYSGEIDKENENTITDALAISHVHISYEDEEPEKESPETDKQTSSYTVSKEIAE